MHKDGYEPLTHSTHVAQVRKALGAGGRLLEAAAWLQALQEADVPEYSELYQKWLGVYKQAVGR